MMMVLWIIIAVFSGGLFGYLFLTPDSHSFLGTIVSVMLSLLIVSAGVDIGQNLGVMRSLLKRGHQVIWVPILLTIGSLIGGALASVILSMSLWEVLAVSSGVGWYSLTGPMITELYNIELGTVGFLSNVIREISAFIMIPLVARVSYLAAIGPGGATTMDSTLPVISRFTNPETSVIAFFSGFMLSFVPPVLIPLFLGWV